MLEGIGILTITGTLGTVVVGATTPLDCYVGLGAGVGDGDSIEQPVGSLGCEYDINGNIRIFAEHLSSPSTDDDHPGMNHAGVKVLFPVDPVTLYAGVSYEFGSHLVDMDSPLAIAGVETNGNIRLYAEHVNSIVDPGEGFTHGGIKFIF
jgi:hypothetical protein